MKSLTLLTVAALAVGTIAAVGPQALAGGTTRALQRAAGANEVRLFAEAGTVAYYSNGKFKSEYRERVRGDQLIVKFKFEVEAFTPNAEVPVLINGTLVATTVVDPLGRGEFQYQEGDNNPGDKLPLPGGFPRIQVGDSITIGNLTTTFH